MCYMYRHFLLHLQLQFDKVITTDSLRSHNPMQSMWSIQVLSNMLAICTYYADIMLNVFATYYAIIIMLA